MSVRTGWAYVKIKLAELVQYRTAGIAGAGIGIVWALIEIALYTAFFTYGTPSAGGLTQAQTVSYVWLAQAFWVMLPIWFDPDIQAGIDSGDVGLELCRPVDLYTHWLFKNAAGRLAPLAWRGALTLLAGLLMPRGMHLGAPVSWAGLCCCLLLLGSAFVSCTVFSNLLCALRMNVTVGVGPVNMVMIAVGILAGNYLPLQLWPQSVQKLLLYQPFAGYLDIPIRLYIGSMPVREVGLALALQVGWAAVFYVAGRVLLRARLKTIIVQGG